MSERERKTIRARARCIPNGQEKHDRDSAGAKLSGLTADDRPAEELAEGDSSCICCSCESETTPHYARDLQSLETLVICHFSQILES